MNRLLFKFPIRQATNAQIQHVIKQKNPGFLSFQGQQEPFAVETKFRWQLQKTGGNRIREKQILALQKSKKPFLLLKHVDRMVEYFQLVRYCNPTYDKDELLHYWTLFWISQLSENSQDMFNSFKSKNGCRNDIHALKKIYDKGFYMCVDYANMTRANRYTHKKFVLDKGKQFKLGRSRFDKIFKNEGAGLNPSEIRKVFSDTGEQVTVFEERLTTINDVVPLDDDIDIITSCIINKCMLFSSDLYNDVYDNFGNFLLSIKTPSRKITELLLQFRLLMHFARRHIATPKNFGWIPKPDIYLLPGTKDERDEQRNYPFSEVHYKARQVDAIIIIDTKDKVKGLKEKLAFIRNLPEETDVEIKHKERLKKCINYYNKMPEEVLNNYLIKYD